jgi:hypothetical protein
MEVSGRNETVERLLHLRRKISREQSKRRLNGLQWRSRIFGEEKNNFSTPGIELYFVHQVTFGLVTFT